MAFTACGPKGGGAQRSQGPPPLAVDVSQAKRQDIATFVTLDGQIAPLQEATLSTPQSGNVAAVYVNEGQRVGRGQLAGQARRLHPARPTGAAGGDRAAADGAARLVHAAGSGHRGQRHLERGRGAAAAGRRPQRGADLAGRLPERALDLQRRQVAAGPGLRGADRLRAGPLAVRRGPAGAQQRPRERAPGPGRAARGAGRRAAARCRSRPSRSRPTAASSPPPRPRCGCCRPRSARPA